MGSYSTSSEIYTETLDNAIVDQSYNFQLEVGGISQKTWSIISGKLPDGLTLTQDGIITGITTKEGTFTFTVEVETAIYHIKIALCILL